MNIQIAIADLCSELADPRQHREPIHGWTPARHKIITGHHVTIQQGLIAQLHDAVSTVLAALDDNATRGVPSSTPPLQVDALDRYLDIAVHAATWCHTLGIRARLTPAGSIRALAGSNPGDRASDLLADLRRWRSWAATMTGWQTIYTPRAACPVLDCTSRGTLRINLDRHTGICVACRSWWDEATISILAQHIADTSNGHEIIPIRSGRVGHGGWASRATST